MSKKKFELSSLDINNTGVWPYPAKVAACCVIGAIILFLAWWLMISSRQETLKGLEAEEISLKAKLTEKQGDAANLEPLKLPSKNEMPDLIVDISQTALATGINNELFEPQPETKREFYAEKPINLRMVGSYHQFGAFVSGVASLPRVVIMTMHNISLKPRSPTDPALELKGTVRTYRYLSEDEAETQAATVPGAAPGAVK